jgi:hypothetical protein
MQIFAPTKFKPELPIDGLDALVVVATVVFNTPELGYLANCCAIHQQTPNKLVR